MAKEFSILNKFTEVKGMDNNAVYYVFKTSKNNVLKVLKKLILDELQSEYDQEVNGENTRLKKKSKKKMKLGIQQKSVDFLDSNVGITYNFQQKNKESYGKEVIPTFF